MKLNLYNTLSTNTDCLCCCCCCCWWWWWSLSDVKHHLEQTSSWRHCHPSWSLLSVS